MQFEALGGSQSAEMAGSRDANFKKVLAQREHSRVGGGGIQPTEECREGFPTPSSCFKGKFSLGGRSNLWKVGDSLERGSHLDGGSSLREARWGGPSP